MFAKPTKKEKRNDTYLNKQHNFYQRIKQIFLHNLTIYLEERKKDKRVYK